MKGLPAETNLSDLIDAEVTQICFGGAGAVMKFDKEIELTIESGCKLGMAGMEMEVIDEFRSRSTQVCGLLGERIRNASCDPLGGLLLEFHSGAVVHITNDSAAYESFQLRIGTQLFYA